MENKPNLTFDLVSQSFVDKGFQAWLTVHMTAVLSAKESSGQSVEQRLNWLRAGVLGANDGIVSVASLVVGVAGATSNTPALVTAGIAGLVGGAISMALGEYVSVSSQRDSERAMIAKERHDLSTQPEAERDTLAAIYEGKGLTPHTARQVADELTAHDALSAHLEAKLRLDENDLVSPGHAAISSAISFVLGAALPLLAILLPPPELRVPITFVAVLIALVLTGSISAHIGGSNKVRATLRLVIGGMAALLVTWLIGTALGTAGVV